MVTREGADVTVATSEGVPLHNACLSGDLDLATVLLHAARGMSVINSQNHEGNTPLHMVTMLCRWSVLRDPS